MNGLTYNKIVLFGDSITELGYSKDFDFSLGGALQDDYVRRLDILNRGYGGYNSKWARVILPKILAAETSNCKVELVVIFFGTNDARNTFQKVLLDEYKENLTYMVDICHHFGIKSILIGPALFDGNLAKDTTIASNLQNLEYSEAAKTVAEILKVPFVDLWDAFRKYGGWSVEEVTSGNLCLADLLVDGVHYTSKGYRIFYDQLKIKISEFYPELVSTTLRPRLASYDEVDSNSINDSVFKYEFTDSQ